MKIGIIGAGNVGTAFARQLGKAGHEIMLSYSRDEKAMAKAAKQFGAKTGSAKEAAAFGEVVVLAVPFAAIEDAIAVSGPLDGKILWDCTNALKPDLSGLEIGTTTSSGEKVASLATGARVVKAIPPFAELMHSDNPTIGGKPPGVFVCGDDAAAKEVVVKLAAELPSTVVEAGPLENARYIEPASFLCVRLAYGLGMGSRIGLTLLTE